MHKYRIETIEHYKERLEWLKTSLKKLKDGESVFFDKDYLSLKDRKEELDAALLRYQKTLTKYHEIEQEIPKLSEYIKKLEKEC